MIEKATKINDTKTTILLTARKLFAVQGYAGTATRQINEIVKVATGLMYYHFPKGKREILNAIVAQGFTELPVSTLKDTQTIPQLEQQLIALFKQLAFFFEDEDNYQLLIIMIRERPLLTSQQIKPLITIWQLLEQRLLEQLTATARCQRLTMTNLKELTHLLVMVFKTAIVETFLLNNFQQVSIATYQTVNRQIHLLLVAMVANG